MHFGHSKGLNYREKLCKIIVLAKNYSLDLLISEVASLVISHISFRAETLATFLWALERALVVVDPHVDAQILFFGEGFATARARTLKRLGAVVEVKVSL